MFVEHARENIKNLKEELGMRTKKKKKIASREGAIHTICP